MGHGLSSLVMDGVANSRADAVAHNTRELPDQLSVQTVGSQGQKAGNGGEKGE